MKVGELNLVYKLYKLNSNLYKHGLRIIPFLIRAFMRIIFCCDIDPRCKIGEGTCFPHYAMAVMIHKDAVIGKNCIILQCVTIGGRNGYNELPKIGDNVLIGCGAKILGPVKIGNNAKIGANAVVISDIPDNATAVGLPAKIVNRK